MSEPLDAIVIGGGHNGLTCAAYLARAGRRVLVLERRHVLGGAAVSEEVFPGFTFSVLSYVVSLLRPRIIRDLELPRFGLEIIPLDSTFSPLPDDPGLLRSGDPARTRAEISRFSRRDADVYPLFGQEMAKLGRLVKPFLEAAPPDPTSWNPARLWELLGVGRLLGRSSLDERITNLEMFTMSAVDLLERWFESPVLHAVLSPSGIIGTMQGVRSPGTAYVLLHHYMGEIDGAFRAWGFAKGGTGAVSRAIAESARSHGARIRTEAPVAKVTVRDGRATGVVLENGEEIAARCVVSAVDPRRTFLGLVGEEHLEDEFVAAIRRYKLRGSSGKVNLALDGLPEFPGRPTDGSHLRGDITITPSVEYLERAFDEAKYGDFSRRPFLDVVIPSLSDPTLAPPGKHVMSCFVQWAPYWLKDGPQAWPARREEFGDAVVDTLEEFAPGLKDRILHRQVITPWDLERDYGLSEGNIFHGELSLEQLLFLRPVPRWARYATPLRGLWMCASGAHPGGGIMGAPGQLAAKAILEGTS